MKYPIGRILLVELTTIGAALVPAAFAYLGARNIEISVKFFLMFFVALNLVHIYSLLRNGRKKNEP